ncbi:MAG: hypothetical protein ACI9Y1_001918 [Lentisphaeria bacterium]|jgi:hypothetical protein
MQNTSFSSMLQQLSNDHYNRVINLVYYREKRRVILDQIDTFYNGTENKGSPFSSDQHSNKVEVTERTRENVKEPDDKPVEDYEASDLNATPIFSSEDVSPSDITNRKT